MLADMPIWHVFISNINIMGVVWDNPGTKQNASGICSHLRIQKDVCLDLTHWGWDKMPVIFQMTFPNVFSWMKIYEFQLNFHWRLFPRVQLTILQHSDNGLASNRQQTIIWSKDGNRHWYIYEALGLTGLNEWQYVFWFFSYVKAEVMDYISLIITCITTKRTLFDQDFVSLIY